MRIDRNVVYGMYSGLALLMDIYYPDKPNGYGIIHISGSGWSAPLSLDARQLKESSHVEIEGMPLVEAGYTVFSINHRAAPRFRYPAQVEDAQRAVRYIRFHAARFCIDPARIGAIGGSSGGHLVSMLGVLDGDGDPEAESPIDRCSAKVQCVVARAAPGNFLTSEVGSAGPQLLLGYRVNLDAPRSLEYRTAAAASPITHITPDDPPFFFIHGDADNVVPLSQSLATAAAMRQAGLKVKHRIVPGGGHGPGIMKDPDIVAEVRAWFDENLKSQQ